jgi:hypothetical protein
MMSRIGLNEAARGPEADERAEPEEISRTRLEHVCDRLAKHFRHVRRHGVEERDDRIQPALALPEHARNRGSDDHEGEDRHQRKISEVAGMDEAVGIHADRDPLHDLEGPGTRSYLVEALAELRFCLGQALSPCLWGFW